MSRTVAAQDSQNDSFAGLLDRMTRSGQSGQSGSAGRNLAGKRPMTTVTEVKPGRGRLAPDTVELSYERALRLHARRVAEDIDFDLPAAPLEEKPTPLPTRTAPAASQRVRSKTPKPARLTTAPPQVGGNRSAKAQAAIAADTSNQKRGPVRAKSQKAKTSPPAAHPHQRKKAGTTTPARGVAASEIHENSKRRTTAGRASIQKVKAAKALASQLSLHEQRRSIISVRLSEEEFSRLRTRASESGISVSAYMRSCVMDAEHLRAQVKQALAEMRAYTRPQESASGSLSGSLSGSALSRSLQSTAETASRWSRFVSFSATFFFGPWLASRRRI